MTASPDRAGLLRAAIREGLRDSTADATDGHTLMAKDAAERIEERVRRALAATGDSASPDAPVGSLRGDLTELGNEQSQVWLTLERAIWPHGPARGSGSGHYSGFKAMVASVARAALAATGDSEGPLDVRRVKQAIVNVAKRHGIAPDQPAPVDTYSVASIWGYTRTTPDMDAEIAAEYARLEAVG